MKALEKSLSFLPKNGTLPNVILGGDINLPDIDWDNYTVKPNPQYGYRVNRLFLDTVNEHGLQQHVQEPTRLNNILDLLLTTYPDLVDNVQVSAGMSDHSVVTAEISVNPRPNKKKNPRKVFVFKKMDIHKLKDAAREFKQRFVDDIDSRSTNESWEDFKSTVNKMLENNVPSKTIKDKWDVPWMTSSIKKLIRKKQRAYNTSKKYDTPENRTRFKNLRKLVQSELQNSKNEYLMGLLEISNNSNKAFDQVKSAESSNYSVGKRFWSYINP